MAVSHKTQGTDLYFVDSATTAAKVGCITNISGLGGARDQIDVTCLDSAEREFVGGFANPGQVTFGIVFAMTDATHQDLLDLKTSGSSVEWYIGLSDGTAAPTVAASVLTAPTARSGFKFTGYVADVNLEFASNDVVRGTVTVQRSGGVTYNVKA